jgi:hypothetical protein
VRQFDGFLDFRRVDPMPGDMADVVQIPIEAFCAIQYNSSIYNYCIYGWAIKSESAFSESSSCLPIPARW